MSLAGYLELMDWRRRVAELYSQVRRAPDPVEGWERWRRERDEMFRDHPQSPLPMQDRGSFDGLSYFGYDPLARVDAELADAPRERFEIPTSGTAPMTFERIATATFVLAQQKQSLAVYWLDVYGGGLFVPFRDRTSGSETYGAGRYLIDSIKGADLGTNNGRLVLDLNFAYNPSCSYDPRWVCPLAPPANRLDVPVRAGEKIPRGQGAGAGPLSD